MGEKYTANFPSAWLRLLQRVHCKLKSRLFDLYSPIIAIYSPLHSKNKTLGTH